MTNITELYLDAKKSDIQVIVKIWTPRQLTILGKINIIKSLLISKFTRILLFLVQITQQILDKINLLKCFQCGANSDPFSMVRMSVHSLCKALDY